MTAPGSGGSGPTPSSTRRFPPAIARGPQSSPSTATADPTPLIRVVGLTLLVVAVAAHNLLLFGGLDLRLWLVFAGLVGVYAIGAWGVERRLTGAEGEQGWTRALAGLDLVPAVAAVLYTGAGRSWIYIVVLFPAVGQVARGVLPTALLSGLGVVGYVAVVAYARLVDPTAVQWTSQVDRVLLLVLAGAYIVLVAWKGRWERDRVVERVQEAEGSIADLRDDATYLDATRRQAESESLARSEFLSRVGHELRPVLRDLLGAARDLERDAQSDVQVANAHEIGNKGRHLLDVINEVIDLARVETGFLARDLSSVAVLPALQDVLDRAGPAADRRSIRIEATELPAADVFVLANDRKLRQVFANLISNAVKYNSSPGRIEVHCGRHSDRLRIAVTDTGPGIPSDRVEEAFAPFERLGAEATDVTGTGLGLPLARALVEAMHGRMEVEPGPDGAGTTVWFELRLEPAAPAGSGDMEDEPADR